jgi:hypothetical protein
MRIAWTQVFSEKHARQSALFRASSLFGPRDGGRIDLRNIQIEHLPRATGDERFDNGETRVRRSRDDGTEIKRLRTGAQQAEPGDALG